MGFLLREGIDILNVSVINDISEPVSRKAWTAMFSIIAKTKGVGVTGVTSAVCLGPLRLSRYLAHCTCYQPFP